MRNMQKYDNGSCTFPEFLAGQWALPGQEEWG